MPYEVEQKFSLAAGTDIRPVLAALGAVAQPEVMQVDSYFAHPSRDFGQTDEALRIRQVGEQNFVTYKGPKLDATTKTRREIETPIAAGGKGANEFAAILTALGFRLAGQVRKRRQPYQFTWQDWPVEAALDDVAGLGQFLELEITANDDDLAAASSALAALAARLNLGPGERRSYLEMVLGNE